jgi:hypothetical protein
MLLIQRLRLDMPRPVNQEPGDTPAADSRLANCGSRYFLVESSTRRRFLNSGISAGNTDAVCLSAQGRVREQKSAEACQRADPGLTRRETNGLVPLLRTSYSPGD